MKTLKKVLSTTYLPWLLLLVITNLFFTFLVWLANPDVLHILTPVILLFSLILFSFLFFFVQYRLHAQRRAITDFLNNPAPESLQQVLSSLDASLRTPMHALLEHVLEQKKNLEDERTRLVTYREFIEEWTHDIKTPLSLATLLLDNHKDEMSPYVRRRMGFVHQEIQTDVDMILYYARLHATHVEYRFETIFLPELLEEVLQNYQEQMEETGILVEVDCPAASVTSDRKVLTFLLSQVLNNAFQYTPRENGQIRVHGWRDDERSRFLLAVQDNGCGVPEEDVPFLFDKGFTGNHQGRQNATGMGLYLVAKYAEALAIGVQAEAHSDAGQNGVFIPGFVIEFSFPDA
jgi:signal transduction histidine kinase